MDKLSSRVMKVKPSATLSITATAKKLTSEGEDVVNFGAGEPDFDTPDYIKEEAVKAINNGFTKYTPSTGMLELKETVCGYLKRTKNLEYSPKQIVIGCGAKHCLYNIFQAVCSEGDKVVIPSPYWVSYPEMVKLAGGVPDVVKTSVNNDFKIDAYQLQDALKNNPKAFILNSPSNPTGTVYSKEELEELSSVFKSTDMYIISDEIYDQLAYDVSVTSIASVDKELKDRVILVGGVSKTYAMTGWRIGFLAAPENITKAIGSLQSHSTSNPCSISQKAALKALSSDNNKVSDMVADFDERRKLMYSKLSAINGIKTFMPKGGFYMFCDVSKFTDNSLNFAKELLDKKKVAVIPGVAFGYEGYIRISFATSPEQIVKGIDRIKSWVE